MCIYTEHRDLYTAHLLDIEDDIDAAMLAGDTLRADSLKFERLTVLIAAQRSLRAVLAEQVAHAPFDELDDAHTQQERPDAVCAGHPGW